MRGLFKNKKILRPILLGLAALAGLGGIAAPAAAWDQFELASRGSASASSRVASVSRKPDTMEIFWIGDDGSIQHRYWYAGSSWQSAPLAPAGSASTVGGITAVSRIPASMEVWWVGLNGSVQDAYFYDGAGWTRFQLAPARSASITGGIAAVSRQPNTMEIFWIEPDGSVQHMYWYGGAGWQTDHPVAPAGSASTKGGITAVSRIPTSMEIWWVGADGSIQDGYWYDPNSPAPKTLTFDFGYVTTDQPLGGPAKLVVSADGYFTFSGSMHDSGFDNIDYDLVGVVALPSGLAFSVHHHGHCEGTVAGLPFGTPNRDDPFTDTDFSQFVRDHWDEFNRAQWSASAQASDKLVGGIEGLVEDVLQKALKKLGTDAATAVIGLVETMP
jgi:hypothetical protein